MAYPTSQMTDNFPKMPGFKIMELKYRIDGDRMHTHDFEELVIVKSGMGKHITANGEYPITRGNIFLIQRGAPHGYREMLGVHIVNILYQPEVLALPLSGLADTPGYRAFFATAPQVTDDFRFRNTLALTPEQMTDAEECVRRLENEQERGDDGFCFAITAEFMRLLLLVSRAAAAPALRREGDDMLRISRILRFIEENYENAVRIDDLAEFANMTPRTLERFFRKATGAAPMEYLVNLRLNKAAERLLNSSAPVTSIALESGFTDCGYFSRAFKKKFTAAPREYRRRFAAAEGAAPAK